MSTVVASTSGAVAYVAADKRHSVSSLCRSPRISPTRPSCRVECRVTASPAELDTLRREATTNDHRRVLPRVLYSVSPRDVGPSELLDLLRAAHWHDNLLAPLLGDRPIHGFDSAGLEAVDKLEKVVRHSLAVVAAFAREEDLPRHTLTSIPPGNWGWTTSGRQSKRRLVGFVHAAGDGALVATLHNLVVHPDLQGLGLGRRLLRRIIAQMKLKHIHDVGLMSPAHTNEFFERCSFGPDEEQSVPMRYNTRMGSFTTLSNKQLMKNGCLQRKLQSEMQRGSQEQYVSCA